MAVRTALHLRQRGVKRLDLVSECGLNHINSRVPYLAALFLRVQYSFIDPRLPKTYLAQILIRDNPKFLFVTSDFIDFAEEVINMANIKTNIVCHGRPFGQHCDCEKFDEFLKPVAGEEKFKPCRVRDIHEEYIMISTSGSTGNPKRVCLSHYTMMAQSFLFCGMRPKMLKVLLSYATLFSLLGSAYTVFPFAHGITLITPQQFDIKKYWSIISKYKVSFTFLPTSYVAAISKMGLPEGTDLSELKEFCHCGSIMSEEVVLGLRKLLPNVRISPCYGQTEMGGVIASFNYEDPEILEMAVKNPTASGGPVHGISYKVKDLHTGETLGPNKMGELYIKSKLLMVKYLDKDMKEYFDSEGWYKTGDLIMYDENLCFYVIDRLKMTYLYKNFYVAPALIERRILEHPAVEDVGVAPIPHPDDVHHSIAFVKLKAGTTDVTPETIVNFVKESLEEHYHLTGGCVIVDALPRTHVGKIDMAKMKSLIPEQKQS